MTHSERETTRQIGRIKEELDAIFIGEDNLKRAVMLYEEATRGFVPCHWCGKLFKPTGHNLVYLGGQGEVYGCNQCLELKEVSNGESV